MAKINIKAGDLFYISDYKQNENIEFRISKNRVGKIIFASKLFKRMIAFIVSVEGYDDIPQNLSEIKFNNEIIYTWDLLLRTGGWKIVGNQKVTEKEIELTTRLVGSTLMILDEELGLVPQNERSKYKKQLISGEGLVYDMLNENLD